VPNDGPTSKADCLNWVYQGVVLEERRRDRRFDILLMHDAEDIIHPLSLRLYSLLIPKYQFVQTPVFSLDLKPTQLVAGTYVDEFGEHHLKEMMVRQAMGGLVPSAGVGSAFERSAFDEIALSHEQQPFNVASLTEDYEIGLKFRLSGKRVCFACHTVEIDAVEGRGLFLNRPVRTRREEYIATREYFPSSFGASVRQRSRWILGIALQAWAQIGWKGALPVRYCLWRDRKGLLNNLLLLLGYALVAYLLGRSIDATMRGTGWNVAGLVPRESPLSYILALNLGALLWRASVKMLFVRRLYGLGQALLVLPRLAVANLIGILATARAVRMYVRHRITGLPLRWLKTTHVFPGAEGLSARRRRLGELLVEREAVVSSDIDAALALQRRVDLPLGELLAVSGVLSERRVVHRLAEHLRMRVRHPDPAEIAPDLLQDLPEAEAEEMNVLPFSREGRDGALVAVARPLRLDERSRLEERLNLRVEPVLSLDRALPRARCVAYRSLLHLLPPRPRLGEGLVERGELDPRELPALLEEQLETKEMLAEMLLRKSLMDERGLRNALACDGGFRCVSAQEGDSNAVERVGYGHCALYSLVPLRHDPRGGRVVIASAFPIHPQEEQVLSERLGEQVELTLAPLLQVRLALAIARRFTKDMASGMDELELAVLAKHGLSRQLPGLLSAARAAGTSPLSHLRNKGEIDAPFAARVRAEVLGLPIAHPPSRRPARAGWLPPGLEHRHAIEVLDAGGGSLVLAAPRPSSQLARRTAYLLPGWRVAWQVAAPTSTEKEAVSDRAA
jgi:adsorption protein B